MKKLLSIFLCALLLAALAIPASAAETTFSISSDKATVYKGDTFTVTVSVSGGDPCTSLGIVLKYDDTLYEIVEGKTGNVPDASLVNWNGKGFAVLFSKETVPNATLGTVTMRALKDAPDTKSAISGSASVKNGGTSLSASSSSASVTVSCKHTWGEWKVSTAASCKGEGVENRICSKCGKEETKKIEILPHTEGDWTTKTEPTCGKAGEKVKTCTVCGEVLKTEEIPATGKHTFGEPVVKAPTCTEKGSETRTCTSCGAKEEKEIPAAGHKPSEDAVIVKEPTCEEEGIMEGKCSVCGETLKNEPIPALGHKWGEWEQTKAPTCTEKGEETRKCTVCDKAETKPIDALGHKWGEWSQTKAPTCTEKGEETRTCTVCDEPETREIPALGHKWLNDWTPDKVKENHYHTCEICKEIEYKDHEYEYTDNKDGKTHTAACVCSYTLVDEKHDYHINGEVIEKPTTSKEGKQEILCVCGAKTIKTLPKKEANLDNVPKTDDITGQLVLGGASVIAMLACAWYLLRRKLVK